MITKNPIIKPHIVGPLYNRPNILGAADCKNGTAFSKTITTPPNQFPHHLCSHL